MPWIFKLTILIASLSSPLITQPLLTTTRMAATGNHTFPGAITLFMAISTFLRTAVFNRACHTGRHCWGCYPGTLSSRVKSLKLIWRLHTCKEFYSVGCLAWVYWRKLINITLMLHECYGFPNHCQLDCLFTIIIVTYKNLNIKAPHN